MSSVRLEEFECRKRGRLPEVCMVCGEETQLTFLKEFIWFPQWTYFFVLLGVLPVFILQMVLRKKMSVYVPICPRHRYHWAKRTAAMVLGVLALLVFMVVFPIWYTASKNNGPGAAQDQDFAIAFGISAGIFVVFGIILWLFVRRGVNVDQIDEDSIYLSGVSTVFLQMVKERREAKIKLREQPDIIEGVKLVAKPIRVVTGVAKPVVPPVKDSEIVNPLPDSAID